MTADVPPPVSGPIACVERPESRAYVAAVKERAYANWQVTADDPQSQAVIAFRLDEHGQVVSSEVRTSSSPSAASQATAALAAGAPYPPMPPEAKCLARMKLIARFELPDAPAAQAEPEKEAEREWQWSPRLVLVIVGAAFSLLSFLWGRTRSPEPDDQPANPAPDQPQQPALPGPVALGERSQLRTVLILGATLLAAALFYWLAS